MLIFQFNFLPMYTYLRVWMAVCVYKYTFPPPPYVCMLGYPDVVNKAFYDNAGRNMPETVFFFSFDTVSSQMLYSSSQMY